LLIFGLTVRYRPMEAGSFHCPREGGDRDYVLLEARRWASLFFVPLFPLKVLGMVVECESCHGRFDSVTLRMPTSATMEHKIDVAARSLLGAVAACDPMTHAHAVSELEGFLGAPTYCASDLVAHSRIQTPAQRQEVLAAAGRVLDPAGRESLLMAAARAGARAGAISADIRRLVSEAGVALGMTPVHVEGVLTVAQRAVDEAV